MKPELIKQLESTQREFKKYVNIQKQYPHNQEVNEYVHQLKKKLEEIHTKLQSPLKTK